MWHSTLSPVCFIGQIFNFFFWSKPFRPEDMAKALNGAYGLFVITNFWEHFDYQLESAQAKAIVEAGKIAGVEHFVLVHA